MKIGLSWRRIERRRSWRIGKKSWKRKKHWLMKS